MREVCLAIGRMAGADFSTLFSRGGASISSVGNARGDILLENIVAENATDKFHYRAFAISIVNDVIIIARCHRR